MLKKLLTIRVITITDKPMSIITSTDIILSLSSKNIEQDLNFNNYNNMTHFEYSMITLKEIIQAKITNDFENEILDGCNLENKKDFLGILIKLVYLINAKDEYTRIHSQNVAEYALLLAKELELDESDIKIIQIGALLHDIGKLGISDNILKKQGSLSTSEFELMKKHTIIGEALLPSDSCDKIKQMIRSHHERIDENGQLIQQLDSYLVEKFIKVLKKNEYVIEDKFEKTKKYINKKSSKN